MTAVAASALYAAAALAWIAAWGGIGTLREAHGEHHKAVHGDAP